MAKVSVRYIVDDVDAAIDFYCRQLGFHEDMHPAPSFAAPRMLSATRRWRRPPRRGRRHTTATRTARISGRSSTRCSRMRTAPEPNKRRAVRR